MNTIENVVANFKRFKSVWDRRRNGQHTFNKWLPYDGITRNRLRRATSDFFIEGKRPQELQSMATKTVNLECVRDMAAESLIAALCRFTSKRAILRRIYRDNDSNFVKTNILSRRTEFRWVMEGSNEVKVFTSR